MLLLIDGKNETQKQFDKRVFQDVSQSKKKIEEEMGYEVVTMAYPYGEYSDDTIKILKKAGYKIGFTTKKGLATKGELLFELDRITANGNYSGAQLIQQIENSQ